MLRWTKLGLTKLTWSMLRWTKLGGRWAKQSQNRVLRIERINETQISKYVRKHLLMIQYDYKFNL